MVSSAAMSSFGGLGYGTQIMLDGAYADAAKLSDEQAASAVLEQLMLQVEPNSEGASATAVSWRQPGAYGVSAALIQGETAMMLHTFPALRTVTLHLFSAHGPSLSTTTRMFLAAYDVGRFQSSVRAFGHYPPRDPDQLVKALAGQRDYARLRVTPAPSITT